MEPWEIKAHRTIAALCRQSFEAANRLPSGRLRRKPRPYAVPADAAHLVEVLGWHDRTAAELAAKQTFQDHAFGIVTL